MVLTSCVGGSARGRGSKRILRPNGALAPLRRRFSRVWPLLSAPLAALSSASGDGIDEIMRAHLQEPPVVLAFLADE
ncbi:hypothetical protein, partial [Rhodoblastus acidophilus]|uniref:hypothetical protein n=1 Tax=Rhodoblastus acidophilus TaxID=1074 RepID=UPI001AEDAC43